MGDKKSVVLTFANGNTTQFMEKEGVAYDYQIGDSNGVLSIIEKRSVESLISVPDEEEIIQSYSPGAWAAAKMV